MDTDWWFVIDCRGEKGWAPANYFQPVIVAPDDAPPAEEFGDGKG